MPAPGVVALQHLTYISQEHLPTFIQSLWALNKVISNSNNKIFAKSLIPLNHRRDSSWFYLIILY